MKTTLGFFIGCGLLAGLSATNLVAEEVTVFAADDNLVNIPRPAVISDFETEDRELTLLVYKPGQNMGSLKTGETDLAPITKKALSGDRSNSPFFGPCCEFIVRDTKGQHFIISLEYKKDHKAFTGWRAAIAPLNDLGSKGAVFVGDPYQGVTYDKAILEQLKEFAAKLPDEKKPDAAEESK
jgi:hypothetical protein